MWTPEILGRFMLDLVWILTEGPAKLAEGVVTNHRGKVHFMVEVQESHILKTSLAWIITPHTKNPRGKSEGD